MDSDLIENLQAFDLSEYESKAYSALVSAGTASTVTELSQICDVPRSNLYSVLEKLNRKGFVETQGGRPQLFKSIPPNKVLKEVEEEKKNRLTEARESALEKLENLKGEEDTETVPALVWGIKGYDSVMSKMKGMIKRSKKDMLINTPDSDVLTEELYEELEKAEERGVKIKISIKEGEDIEDLEKIAMVRTRDKIHGIDIVADSEEVMLAPQLPAIGAWLDNPEMALHVKNFLEILWKDSKILKEDSEDG